MATDGSMTTTAGGHGTKRAAPACGGPSGRPCISGSWPPICAIYSFSPCEVRH